MRPRYWRDPFAAYTRALSREDLTYAWILPSSVACPWPAFKMVSRKKALLFVLLLFSAGLLLLHQNAHLNWFAKVSSFTCQPLGPPSPKHTAVGFVKTHKTASSTIQNLLFRFAERHKVMVALPRHPCDHRFCYPLNFSARFVHPNTIPPRIIASHLRFNHDELRHVMPRETVYITILREPVAMFESLFTYYNQYCPAFQRVPNGSIETFLNNPHQYYRSYETNAMYAHNTLVHDLGGDPDHNPNDPTYLPNFIRQMEGIFSLVMLAEYFDESLVLLRHLLSWDLDDILYIKLNMRTPESKLNVTSAHIVAQIRAWNALDAGLYDHFKAAFWQKLSQVGWDCVQKEVQALHEACERLANHCFQGQPQLLPSVQIANKKLRPWKPNPKVDIIGYNLSGLSALLDKQCVKLVMPEVQYSAHLLQKQSLMNLRRAGFRWRLGRSGLPHPLRHHELKAS